MEMLDFKHGDTIGIGEAAFICYGCQVDFSFKSKIDDDIKKNIFKKLLYTAIDLTHNRKMDEIKLDKVMALKGPPNEAQVRVAKDGYHLILLLKFKDVNISLELMGKGFLIQLSMQNKSPS